MGAGWAATSGHSPEGKMKGCGRAGQRAPHLTSLPKELATISMTKQSPCQFGLAPRGDLPTAFEMGSRNPHSARAGGWGRPDASTPPASALRSGVQRGQDPCDMGTVGTEPWGQQDGRHGSGDTLSQDPQHPHTVQCCTQSTHRRPPRGRSTAPCCHTVCAASPVHPRWHYPPPTHVLLRLPCTPTHNL